jgi:predicted ATPase
MKTFKISNFRLFNSDGVKVNFKPVTILTGTNSSGKSSFVKAMMLLRNYLHGVKTDESKNPAAVELDFTDQSLKLSGFEDNLNYSCKEGESMNFTIESTSNYAPFDFEVEYSFVASPYSKTKGELKSIKLLHDGDILCQANAKDGRISYVFPELKGKLMNAFLIYLKGITFFRSSQRWSGDIDDPGEFLSAESRSGHDITDWRKYALDIFHHTKMYQEDGYDMTIAIRKYEETGILFYFPLLEELGSISKADAIEKLRTATAGKDFNDFLDSNGRDMRDMVISEFTSSNENSFMDFYRTKENEALDMFIINDKNEGALLHSNYLSDILGGMFEDFGAKNWINANSANNVTPFATLCRVMHIWQDSLTSETDSFICRRRHRIHPTEDITVVDSYHILPGLYQRYLVGMISEIFTPSILENFKYIGTSFTPVQRLYSYDGRSSLVDSIKMFRKYSRIVEQNKDKKKVDNGLRITYGQLGAIKYKPGTFINKWLKELGIASNLIIEDETDGLGFKLFLEGFKSGRRVSLADQGHGITQMVSILLQIECEILNAKIMEAHLYDPEDMTRNYGESIIAIEEPEVSLHPSMQSRLAMLFEDAARNGVHLIIETHSEYLVRRTQAYVAHLKTDEDFKKNPFVVYYFNNDGTAYDLGYMKSGRFANSFGTGFFDEAGKSSIEILRREKEDRR